MVDTCRVMGCHQPSKYGEVAMTQSPRWFLVRCALVGFFLHVVGVRAAYAGVQTSGSFALFPSESNLAVNDTITLEVTVSNTSSNTPPLNTNFVPATLTGTTTVKLACADSSCLSELPGTLTFVSCDLNDPGVLSCNQVDANTVAITMTATG